MIDLFSQQLYTLRGQKLFRNIQEKYVNNLEFRSDVDSYIANFEEMLSESIHSSSDSHSVTQEHIMSNYGKVYTMLVHASGRTL